MVRGKEKPSVFRRRRYCSRGCANRMQRLAHVKVDSLYKRAKFEVPMKAACEVCGTSSDLTRHHLDENPANNAPENIQTLCRSCHTKWHWRNGKTIHRRRDGVEPPSGHSATRSSQKSRKSLHGA